MKESKELPAISRPGSQLASRRRDARMRRTLRSRSVDRGLVRSNPRALGLSAVREAGAFGFQARGLAKETRRRGLCNE